MNTKQNNIHKAHPTECALCGRKLPKRAFRQLCAACIKLQREYPRTWERLVRAA